MLKITFIKINPTKFKLNRHYYVLLTLKSYFSRCIYMWFSVKIEYKI